MSFFNNPWIFSATITVIVGVVFYLNSEKLLNFLNERTVGTQKEILEIMDKLLISQDTNKFKRNGWIVSGSLSLLGFVLFWPNVILSVLVALGVFLGTLWFLKKFLENMWEKHCDHVVDDLVEGLTIMCNSLKVGLSLGQGLDRVIKGYPGALSKEFKLILNKMELGKNLEESMEEMGKRVQRTEIDMLVSTVNILKETGGNLAETFFVMAETIRQKQKMDKKIKALTAQGMMQAKIISCLPFGLIGLFFVMDPEYINPLFTQPLGWLCLTAVVVLVVLGWFFMKKMVEIKV